MRAPAILVLISCWPLVGGAVAMAAEPLPISKSYWQDEAFLKSFNGSYRIEAKIEPVVSTEERGLLVEVQELMAKEERAAALEKIGKSKLTEGSAALQFNLGNLHFEEGSMEEAAKAYGEAIAKYPAFRRAHRNLGLVRVREGEIDQALESLLEALRLGDSDGTTYGMLGFCRLQRGEHASALQAYRMALLSQPESAQWKAGVAQCLQNLNARDEAVALLDEVIRQFPEEASYAGLQASLLVELERPEDAVKALELPRRLGSLSAEGLLTLGELHLRAGRIDRAISSIDEAFASEQAPAVDRVLAVGALAMSRSEWELAKRILDKATPDEGEVPLVLTRLSARLMIDSGESPEEGAKILRELIAKDPTDGRSLLALGKFERSKGDPGAAELLFERASADETAALDAWIELARLRVSQERYTKALEAVDQALLLQPTEELEAYRDGLANLVEASR